MYGLSMVDSAFVGGNKVICTITPLARTMGSLFINRMINHQLAMFSRRQSIALVCALAVAECIGGVTEAKPLLTATCEAPQGPRVDYGQELLPDPGTFTSDSPRQLKLGNDSFSGVRPIFIVNDDRSMTVLWGDHKPIGLPDGIIRENRAEHALIVSESEEQITAIQIGNSSIWLYSLYPRLGYGLYTRNSHHVIGHHLVGSMMHSTCKFSP